MVDCPVESAVFDSWLLASLAFCLCIAFSFLWVSVRIFLAAAQIASATDFLNYFQLMRCGYFP